MMIRPRQLSLLLFWQAFLFLTLAAMFALSPARAAVPHESAVPAYAEEQTILQTEKDQPQPGFGSTASGRQHFDRHYIIPPGHMTEQDVVLQRGGNTWRTWRNGPFAAIAGTILLVVPLLIFGFYRTAGPAEEIHGGGQIERFTGWERLVHWALAITFIVLAVTGIIIIFGKKILLPWMGHDVFYWFALISKYLHNFVGPLFIVCSLLMFFTFLRRNRFNRFDWQWIKKGGGLIRHEHIPSGFFNAGEKVWFWVGVVLLGLLMSVTGMMLNFPYFKGPGNTMEMTRYLLQAANYLHIIGATMYIAFAMGHIYIGTLGTPGAWQSMRYGRVDEAWAHSHHELWYNELVERHRTGAPRTTPGDGPDGAPAYPRG